LGLFKRRIRRENEKIDVRKY